MKHVSLGLALLFTSFNILALEPQDVKIGAKLEIGIQGKKRILEIESLLGKGDFGTVYKGKSTDGLDVAVKIPNASGSLEGDWLRFNQLKKLAEEKGKKNEFDQYVTRLLGFENGILILELADSDLNKYLQKNKISAEELKKLFLPLISFLRWLHDNGSFHGDIKLDNIFVYKDSDGNNLFKFADFASEFSESVLQEDSLENEKIKDLDGMRGVIFETMGCSINNNEYCINAANGKCSIQEYLDCKMHPAKKQRVCESSVDCKGHFESNTCNVEEFRICYERFSSDPQRDVIMLISTLGTSYGPEVFNDLFDAWLNGTKFRPRFLSIKNEQEILKSRLNAEEDLSEKITLLIQIKRLELNQFDKVLRTELFLSKSADEKVKLRAELENLEKEADILNGFEEEVLEIMENEDEIFEDDSDRKQQLAEEKKLKLNFLMSKIQTYVNEPK